MENALILKAADVAANLPMAACITAVERAFQQLGLGIAAPPSTMAIHAQEGVFHIKAGILATERREYFAVKSNGNFPGNRARNGLPTIQGVVILCDATDGRVLALLDSMELTARRTAAATGVAAKYLARPDSRVAAICGCGIQAPAQLEALAAVLPLQSAVAYDLDYARAEEYAARMTAALGFPVQAVGALPDAVSVCDVLVTCTTSREYLLHAEHVRDGMLIAGVGVDNEDKRELAPDLLARALVVTDVTSQCAQIGDLHHAIDAGVLSQDDVYADLGAIAAGRAPGRTNAEQVFVFDSTGIALQDVAAAAAIYELLEEGAHTNGLHSELRT
jgi:alanine dehydrogenase